MEGDKFSGNDLGLGVNWRVQTGQGCEQRRFKGNNWGLQICHLDEVTSQEFSLGVIKEKKESFYTDHWGGGQNAVKFKQQVHLGLVIRY